MREVYAPSPEPSKAQLIALITARTWPNAAPRLRRGGSILSRVPGTLYVVATPIGNLEDLSARAARVLAEAEIVAAERVQTAKKLLRHLAIEARCLSYNDRNKRRTTQRLLNALRAGDSVALICDAGTPGLSDPGQDLVAAAVEAGAAVTPIPGPSAATALLSVAGTRTRTVTIIGFLPKRTAERRRLLTTLAKGTDPVIAFESPHRLRQTLAEITDLLPTAQLVVGRELTKLHEEIWRGTPEEALAHFSSPRGEFTLLLVPSDQPRAWSDDEVRAALLAQRDNGVSRSKAAAAVAAAAGRPRQAVYALWATEQH